MAVSQAGVGTPDTSQLAKIKKLTAQRVGQQPVAEQKIVSETRPNLERIRQLTAKRIKPAVTEPLPTTEPTQLQPVDITTPQAQLGAGAAAGREAVNVLLEKLKTAPQESSIEKFKRFQKESGRPELISGRQETFKQVQRVTNLLRNLEQDISERGREVGTLTTAQARRKEAVERAPLTRQLEALNETLGLQNLQIKDIDDQIDKFIQLGDKDRADELQRLKDIASLSGLTPDEKELISAKIKEEAERERAELETQKDKQTFLDKGIEDLRKFATDEGVITTQFGNVVAEAQRRLDAGEDPKTILADVSAAVMQNPDLQRKFQLERLKSEASLAKALKGTGSKSFKIKITDTQRQKMSASGFSESDIQAESFDQLSPEAQRFLGFTEEQKDDQFKLANSEAPKIITDKILPEIGEGNTISELDIQAATKLLQQDFPALNDKNARKILEDNGFTEGKKVKEKIFGKELKV